MEIYTIRSVPTTNSLGMHITLYEVLANGLLICECRDRARAEQIIAALTKTREEVEL